MLTFSFEQNYICYYIIGIYNNDMFRPYMWAIIRLWLDLELRLILACVQRLWVVMGRVRDLIISQGTMVLCVSGWISFFFIPHRDYFLYWGVYYNVIYNIYMYKYLSQDKNRYNQNNIGYALCRGAKQLRQWSSSVLVIVLCHFLTCLIIC